MSLPNARARAETICAAGDRAPTRIVVMLVCHAYAWRAMLGDEHTTPRVRQIGRRAFLGLAAVLTAAGIGWLTRRRDSPEDIHDQLSAGEKTSPSSIPSKDQPASPPTRPDGFEPGSSRGHDEPSGRSATVEAPDAPEQRSEPEPPQPGEPVESITSVDIAEGAATAGVVAVGRAYLRDRPDESDPAKLLSALGASDGDAVAAARRNSATDFAHGRTVVVDGWILSSSEARAAAVIALACDQEC